MAFGALYWLAFMFSIVHSQGGLPCLPHVSVDISDAQRLPGHVFVKNNITYKRGDYYYAADGVRRGCICEVTSCLQTCCGPNEVFVKRHCIRRPNSELNISVFEDTSLIRDFSMVQFTRINSSTCPEKHQLIPIQISDLTYLQKNGSIYYISGTYEAFYAPGYYCIGKKDDNTSLIALCEFYDQQLAEVSKMYAKGMIISMPFLLVTFLVYAILPESNLHRKALMNYVLTLLIAYILLVVVQLYPGSFARTSCSLLGYMIIFFFLVSFFWMNVMCLDMWFAFSGMRGFNGRRIAERKRFFMYFAYAVGVPILHTIVVLIINEVGDQNSSYYPGIGESKCFLAEGLPNLLYFYGPMAILIIVNVTLFILTAIKIQKVKKETSMLKHSDSKKHSYEDDKQKFNLYVKLLFAMGINWSMEVISWAIGWKTNNNVPHYVWYLTDFCNAVYGVFIFFIFVFKRKIWKSLKRRYYVLRGQPHLAHSISVTQTTRASNYSNTESSIADHRMNELKNGRGEERMLNQH